MPSTIPHGTKMMFFCTGPSRISYHFPHQSHSQPTRADQTYKQLEIIISVSTEPTYPDARRLSRFKRLLAKLLRKCSSSKCVHVCLSGCRAYSNGRRTFIARLQKFLHNGGYMLSLSPANESTDSRAVN